MFLSNAIIKAIYFAFCVLYSSVEYREIQVTQDKLYVLNVILEEKGIAENRVLCRGMRLHIRLSILLVEYLSCRGEGG
jgi:hypothetical protein